MGQPSPPDDDDGSPVTNYIMKTNQDDNGSGGRDCTQARPGSHNYPVRTVTGVAVAEIAANNRQGGVGQTDRPTGR